MILGLALGCDAQRLGVRQVERKREFARLNQKLVMLQGAENRQKKQFLSSFEKERCVQLCSWHDSCVHAFAVHVDGIAGLEAIELELKRTRSGHERDLVSKLHELESKLDQARELLLACAATQGELDRAFSR